MGIKWKKLKAFFDRGRLFVFWAIQLLRSRLIEFFLWEKGHYESKNP